MKKFAVLALALIMMLGAMVACSNDGDTKSDGVMTYKEYVAAALDSEVTIEAYVQATQSWWSNDEGKGLITAYLQDKDGAYFAYEMACSEADSKKLVPGTKIQVKGYKSEWEGEVEITDATFTFMDGKWTAEALDLTDSLTSEDKLLEHQNEKVAFKGMRVVSWAYQNETQGQDIYLTLSKNDKNYSFCVESYLTPGDSDLYKAVEALKEGDVIDVEGFLYWYKGMNPHITSVTKN